MAVTLAEPYADHLYLAPQRISHQSYFYKPDAQLFLMRNQQCQSTEGNTVIYLYYCYYNRFMAPWILSRSTQMRWYQQSKTKTNLDFMEQEKMSGSGTSWAICKSAPRLRHITMPAPHHSVFTDRTPFLPPNQQYQSNECRNKITHANHNTVASRVHL